jgi:hypothetical protein
VGPVELLRRVITRVDDQKRVINSRMSLKFNRTGAGMFLASRFPNKIPFEGSLRMYGRVLDLVEDRKLMPAVYRIWRYESAEEIVQSAAHLVTCMAG